MCCIYNPIKSGLIMHVVYDNPIKIGLILYVVFDNPIKSGLIMCVIFDNPIKSGLIMRVVSNNPIKSGLTNTADIWLLWVGMCIKMRRKINPSIRGLIMFRGKINPTIRGLILWAIIHRRLIEGTLKAHWWDKKRPQCSRTAALSESKHRLLRGYKHKIA